MMFDMLDFTFLRLLSYAVQPVKLSDTYVNSVLWLRIANSMYGREVEHIEAKVNSNNMQQ
jgi:hypothetical protein